MDRFLDSLWTNQVIPLSAFFDDDFDNGTVTFNRITHGDNPALSRRLLSPLSLRGKTVFDAPILFHITGMLHFDDCSLTSESMPGSTEDTFAIKLCFKELPESVSRVEWAQCAAAFWWLNMLACRELRQPVNTEEVFYNDPAGRLRIIVRGLQINPLVNGGIKREQSDGQTSTHHSVPQRLDDRSVRRASYWPNIWFDSLRETGHAAAPLVVPGSSSHQSRTYPARGGYIVHDMMDCAVPFTRISEFPPNVPIRVTFSLELQTGEPVLVMHAKIAKITLLAPFEHSAVISTTHSLHISALMAFHPEVAIAGLRAFLPTATEQAAFDKDWEKNVTSRVKSWTLARQGHQSLREGQLRWEAHVVEYVNYISSNKSAVKTSQTKTGAAFKVPAGLPIWGPVFEPPTFSDILRRDPRAVLNRATGKLDKIKPDSAYLRRLTVVHPYYFKSLRRCPRNASHNIASDGWQSTGSREVHGISQEEAAIGYQIRCHDCKEEEKNGTSVTYCFALTNAEYWEELKQDYRTLPREIPHFFHKCALTRDLFNMVVELRLPLTALGLATHIEQLHLLQYHQKRLEYLHFVEEVVSPAQKDSSQSKLVFSYHFTVHPFSTPRDSKGYSDNSISHDMITEVYAHFGSLRLQESSQYMRTLEAASLSFDHTFRVARKATISTKDGKRERVWKGGMFSAVNERNEIVLYRFCQSGANDEFGESLAGLRRRLEILGVPLALIAVADNCCTVAAAVEKNLPGSFLGLDLKHFKGRYEAVIVGGVHNPHRAAVLRDIVDAILECPAEDGRPAKWRSKEEQVVMVEAMYQKWFSRGGVWSEAAARAHAIQMGHVKKGCLSRPRSDIRSDGSRIEGSHKGWNSLQRANPSGYQTILYLASDHVLRRNIRVILGSKEFRASVFVDSSFGCHHLALVDHIARSWNTFILKYSPAARTHGAPLLTNHTDFSPLPVLIDVPSEESFGAVVSTHALTYGGLIKMEEDDEGDDLLENGSYDEERRAEILQDMNIDPQLANIYEKKVLIPIDPTLLNNSPHSHSLRTDTADKTVKTELMQSELTLVALSKGKAPESATVVDLTQDDEVISSTPQIVDELVGSNGCIKRKRKADVDPECLPGGKIVAKKACINSRAVADRDARQASLRPNSSIHRFFTSSGFLSSTCAPALAQTSIAGSSSTGADTSTTSAAAVSSSTAMSTSLSPPFAPMSTQFGHVKPLSTAAATLTKLPAASSTHRTSTHTIETLSERLPLPEDMLGLSPSERLFKIHTNIDPTSLKIGSDLEYYLFMDLRAEHHWASHRMTSTSYVEATQRYNDALTAAYHNKSSRPPAKKNPRAIMEKLGEIEAEVLDRLARNDFVAKGSGSSTFWTRHCTAVNLVSTKDKPKRVGGVCSRCRTIMHPGKEGAPENHKRGLCSDGVPTHMQNIKYDVDKKTSNEKSPPWPQPAGVFTRAKNSYVFHPFEFLKVVRHMYETVVIQQDMGALTMEHDAFAELLLHRVEVVDGVILFRLFPQLVLPPSTPDSLIVVHNDSRYLRVDCLRTD
ncbi:hypothetical protein BC835DRAFT_1311466 [Cytidiella melzeri]|nr:hypothetical protein BC835DRAFT_1311466 [Cytidiella melzeri]